MTPADAPTRKLPIGMQTFRDVRERGCYYVDKTEQIRRLVENGKCYFLSRPRRFGKSLLVDTIKELFEGSEALFAGLDVHGHWDWRVRHPVVRLDLSGSFRTPDELEENLLDQFADIAAEAGVAVQANTAAVGLRRLIRALRRRAGERVVVLVDEYDKPILDALATPDLARANRDFLHGVYSIIKACDADLAFVLLTGVSRFSKVSIFSGLNNLADITLDPRYSTLCGYTDDDLDTTFADQLPGLDRQAIRDWYNGYNWLGDEKVYNPYDILLLFDRREFDAYWFETGTSSYIVDKLLERGVSVVALDNTLSTGELLSDFDVERATTEALLFQSGYLTIRSAERQGHRLIYRLGYPNREVRLSLTDRLLSRLSATPPLATDLRVQLPNLLQANDFDGLATLLRSVFASIPYQWHTKNNIADYEGYYASVFYALFAAQDFDVTAEDSTSHGRLDMTVVFSEQIYLFEFKVVASQGAEGAEGKAIAQLRERNYAEKYRGRGWPIHLIGVEFSKETRTLVGFEAVPDQPDQPAPTTP